MLQIQDIIQKLKNEKVKVTPQRIAIINYLMNNFHHPCAEDIFTQVSREHPSITMATVYNTLEMLERINSIIKIRLENKVNYEFNMEPHSHFYCKKCFTIYDIWEKQLLHKESVDGHKIDETSVYFKGICSKCMSTMQ